MDSKFSGRLHFYLDQPTSKLLDKLTNELNLSKGALIRQSLRLMDTLRDIEKHHGQLSLITANTKEKVLLLMS